MRECRGKTNQDQYVLSYRVPLVLYMGCTNEHPLSGSLHSLQVWRDLYIRLVKSKQKIIFVKHDHRFEWLHQRVDCTELYKCVSISGRLIVKSALSLPPSSLYLSHFGFFKNLKVSLGFFFFFTKLLENLKWINEYSLFL